MFKNNNDEKNNKILYLNKNKIDNKIKLINRTYSSDNNDEIVYNLYNLNHKSELSKKIKTNFEPLKNS